MPTYTQRLFMGSCRSDYAAKRISNFLDRSGQALMSLFSPEDTTNNEGETQLQIAKYMAYNIRGLTKVAVWIALSISIALLIGQLS